MNVDSEVLKMLGVNLVMFNRLMFPEMFKLEIPDSHKAIYDAISDPEVRLAVVQMPRGFGKTSILQGFLAQQVVTARHKVSIYISDTMTQATAHTETVRDLITTSERVTKLFGPQTGDRFWRVDHWQTNKGATVISRGSNQSIRGLKVGGDRPSLIIFDDPENDINAETPEMCDKLWRKVFAVVKPMLQAGGTGDNTKIVWLGTPINSICVLQRFMKLLEMPEYRMRPDFKVVKVALCDVHGVSAWPELWSDDRIRQEKQFYADAGQLDTFFREYMGQVIASETAEFRIEDARFYTENELPEDVVNYISLDMAFSSNRSADYTAMPVFSVSGSTGGVYVRSAGRFRGKPDEVMQRLTALTEVYKPRRVFIQNATLDEFFKFYANDTANERIPFETVTLSRQKNAKIRRVASLSAMYVSGQLKFKRDQLDLLQELHTHPRPEHDDLSDALATGLSRTALSRYLPGKPQIHQAFNSIDRIRKELLRKNTGRMYGMRAPGGYGNFVH